jgi:hypothetical protein
MKQITTQILYRYWNDVRGSRLAPTRFDIEPTRLAPILSETFILERAGPISFPFRLAGTRVCEQFGRELRGVDFVDFAADDSGDVARALETVTGSGAVLVAQIEAATADGRKVMFEALVLPLLHPAHEVTRYLGSLSVLKAPLWLGAEPLVSSRLVSHMLLWPDGRPRADLRDPNYQRPLMPELAAARIVRSAHRQFRILEGGRKE